MTIDPASRIAAAAAALGRNAPAEAMCHGRLARVLAPGTARAWMVTAIAHSQAGAHDRACRDIERALVLAPADPMIRRNGAVTWHNAGQARVAVEDYAGGRAALLRALALEPGRVVTLLALGRACEGEIPRELQAPHFQRAAAVVAPDDPVAAMSRTLLVPMPAAAARLGVLARWAPATPGLGHNLATVLIGAGQVVAGFRQRRRQWSGGHAADRRWNCPLWNGAPRPGQDVLIWQSQGLGDALLMGSCLPDIKDRPERFTLAVDARLTGLFARTLPGWTVRPLDGPRPMAVAHLPEDLLPDLVGRGEPFPDRSGYLAPLPALRAIWRRRLAALGPGLKVGVAWRSRVAGVQRRRYLPGIAPLMPLFARSDCRFVSLQYDDQPAERAEIAASTGTDLAVWSDLDLTRDLESVAALIAELDLVIAPGTSVADLAGAVGTLCALLLPVPHYRQCGRPDWPWFATTTVFGRPPGADWSVPVAALDRWLTAFAARP